MPFFLLVLALRFLASCILLLHLCSFSYDLLFDIICEPHVLLWCLACLMRICLTCCFLILNLGILLLVGAGVFRVSIIVIGIVWNGFSLLLLLLGLLILAASSCLALLATDAVSLACSAGPSVGSSSITALQDVLRCPASTSTGSRPTSLNTLIVVT